MKNRRFKRTLALVLSMAMTVTGMAVPAAAGEAVFEDESEEAVEEVSAVEGEISETDTDSEGGNVIWVVGDSTVCNYITGYNADETPKFTDATHYYPRYGYGTQIANYLDDTYTVENIAASGRSSKSFLTDSADEYNKFKTEVKEGDYIIIGFGHNDEKSEVARYTNPNDDYQTEGSFAKSLYDNYIKVATDANAKAILCTPIVRRGVKVDENTGLTVLTESEQHITKDVEGFPGGDYPGAIRKLAADTNTILVDLTDITKTKYESMKPEDTALFHAWSKDTIKSVDNTHLNIYGAKWVAYQLALQLKATELGSHVKSDIAEPTTADLEVNPSFVHVDYESPSYNSVFWGDFVNEDGVHFHGTIFGDIGYSTIYNPDDHSQLNEEIISSGSYTMDPQEDYVHIVAKNNKAGKIASTSDAMMMYYYRLPADAEFKLTATADLAEIGNNQSAFGLIARDTIFIDEQVKGLDHDYVVAGSRGDTKAENCFKRQGGTLGSGGALTVEKVEAGGSYELSLVRNSDGTECKFGNEPAVTAGFDFPLNAVDEDYMYVGVFLTRQGDVTFRDVKLLVKDENGKYLVPGVNFDKEITRMKTGDKETVKAFLAGGVTASSNTVSWNSSAPDVVKVEDGQLEALKEGDAVISATIGEYTGKFKISVKDKISVTAVKASETELELTEGDSKTVTATVEPDDAEVKDVAWSSSDDNTATVKNGVITAVKEGNAIITVASTDDPKIKAEIKVTVKKKPEDKPVEDKTVSGDDLAKRLAAVSGNTIEQKKANLALKEDRSRADDTIAIKQTAAGSKPAYELDATTVSSGSVSANGPIKAVVTLAKGSKVTLKGYDKVKSKAFKDANKAAKKNASINAKGVLTGKKMTGSPVTVKYALSTGQEVELTVNVVWPLAQAGKETVSVNGVSTIAAGTPKKQSFTFTQAGAFDIVLKDMPLTAKVLVTKPGGIELISKKNEKGEDSVLIVGEDGELHLKGTVAAKQKLQLTLDVIGKKYKVNLKTKIK